MVNDEKVVDIDALLDLAAQTAKSGQKDHARNMLLQVLKRDKRNENAMMWLAKIARNPKERTHWLGRVLASNPDNEQAQKALKRSSHQQSSSENRVLFIYGSVAVVMMILTIVLLFAVFR
jgi:hypothetical protein